MHVHLPDSLVTWHRIAQPPLTATAVSAKCDDDAYPSHSTAGSPRDSQSVTPAFRLPQGFRAPELRDYLGRLLVIMEGSLHHMGRMMMLGIRGKKTT